MSRFAVMGSPISHSHSPTLHRAGFAHLGFSAEYESVELGKLGKENLAGYNGLSLTMPLKVDAFELADSHDDESLETGVSNTLLIGKDRVFAMNTDVYGIAKTVEPTDARSVRIIGTGATAKSAAIAMRDREITFHGRNPTKVAEIENWAKNLGLSISQQSAVDIVIDTTPGSAQMDYGEHQWLLDVAYASDRNAAHPRLISGLEMLLHQAVIQNASFSSPFVSEKIDLEELTKVMRMALVDVVGEWSNA